MTSVAEAVKPSQVGRKKLWGEKFTTRLPAGYGRRIEALLDGKEDRSEFFRKAVTREIERREAKRERRQTKKD